jgi:hypothetical protein
MRVHRNSRGGTNTVELGPAMFIILIVILIPCIDFMQIGLAYACGWYANHMATREAACAGPATAQAAADNATLAWASSGLGAFVRAPAPVNVATPYVLPDIDLDGIGDYMRVDTTVRVEPMFRLPFVANQTIVFTYSGVRPMEEKGIH